MITKHLLAGMVFSAISISTIADRGALEDSTLTLQSVNDVGRAATIPTTSFLTNLVGLDLLDQNGEPFHVEQLKNKTVLFNFIFTTCSSVCPVQTKVLAEVMSEISAELRSQTQFVSISVDPVNDTPEKLNAFSVTHKANFSNWQFLTGEPEQISALTQRLLIFNEGEQNQPQVHRTSLWLVDKNGRMLQRYRGDPPDKARLIRELNQINRITTQ